MGGGKTKADDVARKLPHRRKTHSSCGGSIVSLVLTAERPPLATDSAGVVRVAGTRVTLDTVVAAFHDGASAEEIAEQYPSLQLSDVYAVIGYYLRCKTEVHEYLAAREDHATDVRDENEARFSPVGVRSRLLARRSGTGVTQNAADAGG
jgi:uncharacterized protein (DUF433 family)